MFRVGLWMRAWRNAILSRKATINIVQLPLEIWEHIFRFLPEHDVIVLSSVCNDFQRIIQRMKPNFNLEFNYHVNMDYLLNYALSTSCTSVNINHCYWLKPREILRIISRTKLQQFHLINCNVDKRVMRAICSLQLYSFSFTYEKKWKSYFEKYPTESAVFLRRLITLKIIFANLCSLQTQLFEDVSKNVLQYCEELQDLMISVASSVHSKHFIDSPTPSFTQHSKSLMPKLKRIESHIDYFCYVQDRVEFLRAILKNKIIPLEHVDFGSLNCYLFREGIRRHPLILPENEALLLTNFEKNVCQLVDFLKDDSLMRQTSYKTICLDDIKMERFHDFADKIISNSGKSIAKLYLRGSAALENILSGIQLFAISCVQITELDLTIVNWRKATDRIHYTSHASEVKCDSNSLVEVEKNKALLEVIANFKNLKKLWISPWLLHCLYHSPRNSKITIKEMPFWKVTKACEQLRELYIRSTTNHSRTNLVHENSLYDIAYCQNLKVLHLSGFCIRTNAEFLLSPIAKGCPQLEELTFGWENVIRNLRITPQTSTFDNSFNFLKKLKKLYIYRSLPIKSSTVIRSLCQCNNYLEKLMLTLKGENSIQSMIALLPHFENLHLICVDIRGTCTRKQVRHLRSVTRKIHDKKPTFYGFINGIGHDRKLLDGNFDVEYYYGLK